MPQARPERKPPPDGQRLVDILADMIRSALTWEDAYGDRPEATQTTEPDGLAGIARRINCPPRSSCLQLKPEAEEKDDDNKKTRFLQASPVDP